MDNFFSEKSPLAPLCHMGEQTADSIFFFGKFQTYYEGPINPDFYTDKIPLNYETAHG